MLLSVAKCTTRCSLGSTRVRLLACSRIRLISYLLLQAHIMPAEYHPTPLMNAVMNAKIDEPRVRHSPTGYDVLCGTCGSRPMLSAPSAPRLLASCSPHAAGLASLMLPTSLLPEFSSPDFSLSLLPATLSTRSCFLGEPLAREALLRGTTAVVSRDHSSISGPETR